MEVRVLVDMEGGCLARTFCLLKVLMVLLPVLGETCSGMTDAGMLLSFEFCVGWMIDWFSLLYIYVILILHGEVECRAGREVESFNLLWLFYCRGLDDSIPRCVLKFGEIR